MMLCRRTVLLVVFLLSIMGLQAQVSGRVIDAQTKVPMAFVTVVVEGQQAGSYTDIDGKFDIPQVAQGATLVFSFVGYKSTRVEVKSMQSQLLVELRPERVELAEAVVLPGENPAEALMRKAIKNKKVNNPEESRSFVYDAYNKLVFTALPDSVYIDNPQKVAELDTSDQEALKFFDEQHLFLMESISERRFLSKGKDTEIVKASKVSGLQAPDFALLSTQLQSFSIYRDEFSLMDLRYLSPFHSSAISKYLFIIEDTTYQDQDTVFVLSFRPRTGKKINGLKGVLHLNSNGYAAQSVIAEPATATETFGIRIRQRYEFIDGQQWFPVQLNTDLTFNNIEVDFMEVVGIGRSYHSNIQLDPELKRRDVGEIAYRMEAATVRQPEEFWNQYRNDSLDSRELQTYEWMDSLSNEFKFDQKYRWFQAFMSGKLKMGKVDFDLSRLMRFNDYEGFRLGGGLATNDDFIRNLYFGGFVGYGFKDRELKGGGDITWKIRRMSNTSLSVAYYSEVFERGGSQFPGDNSWLSDAGYYQLFINQMDRLEVAEAGITSNLPGYLKVTAKVRTGTLINNLNQQLISTPNDEVTLFHDRAPINEAELNVRWSFREKQIQTVNRRVSLARKWPLVGAQLIAGEYEAGDETNEYLRLQVSLDHTFRMPILGDLSFFAHAGRIYGDAPALRQFSIRGTQNDFSVATPRAFETIAPGSVFTDEYAALHIRHSFRDLLFSRPKWKPHVVLVHSMAIGNRGDRDHLTPLAAGDISQGYFESGIELKHLVVSGFSSFGIGAFYRHGSYNEGEFVDNVTFKLSIGFVSS